MKKKVRVWTGKVRWGVSPDLLQEIHLPAVDSGETEQREEA